jgi:hypothetical protein
MRGWNGVVPRDSSSRPPPAANPAAEAKKLEEQCPGLLPSSYVVMSGSTPTYNCVAWAVDDFERPWSPMPAMPVSPFGHPQPVGGYYWPPDLPALMSVATLKELFRRRGYEECMTPAPEEHFQKVAIYGDEIICMHVAVQRAGEPWSSKMGDNADIVHPDAASIECGLVGYLQGVLRRPEAGPKLEPAPETPEIRVVWRPLRR